MIVGISLASHADVRGVMDRDAEMSSSAGRGRQAVNEARCAGVGSFSPLHFRGGPTGRETSQKLTSLMQYISISCFEEVLGRCVLSVFSITSVFFREYLLGVVYVVRVGAGDGGASCVAVRRRARGHGL